MSAAFYLGVALIVAGAALLIVKAIYNGSKLRGETASLTRAASKAPGDPSAVTDLIKALIELLKQFPGTAEKTGIVLMVVGLALVIVFKS